MSDTSKPTPAKLDDAEQQHLLDGIAHLLRLGWKVRVFADQNLGELDLLMTPPTKDN